ncbi:NosD domain-containing protein [Spirosoma rigui]|uniref:NosD domain-containing protein n=1 Tax=Spirosoma rigui TaxID=564064 RepID=UPI0009B12054|nr:NosD domain-containing protein [Spirosoma rigui]
MLLAIRVTLSLLTIWLFARCEQPDVIPDVIVQRQDTMTIASLRAYRSNTLPSSILITDAGRAGVFTLVPGGSAADNMGTVLVTSTGKRYQREYTGPASAYWFGVEPSDTDIGPELQLAVNAANEVVIPKGNYTQLTTVRLRSGMSLKAQPGSVLITLPKTYVSLANAIDPSIFLRDVLIEGLSWNVTSQERGTFGTIYIDGPSVANLTVRQCSSTDEMAKDSTNWLTLKIPAGKTAETIVVQNNSVRAKRMGCEIFNHDNHSIYAGKRINVSNNFFHDCHFGISISGTLEGITVASNLVKDCSLFGIEIAGAARSVALVDNQFEGQFDKFLEGSNDGDGNGSVIGGMLISGNRTVGKCQGGVQLFNAGAVNFTKNNFNMSGILEIGHSTKGGMFTENILETSAEKAVICDNSPNNTFNSNRISNETSRANQATFMAYGSSSTGNILINNKLVKGLGGKYYEGVQGGQINASANFDGLGNILQSGVALD